jgi:hypothetical protein
MMNDDGRKSKGARLLRGEPLELVAWERMSRSASGVDGNAGALSQNWGG